MSGWLVYPRIAIHTANYAKGRQGYKDIWFVVHCTDDDYSDNYPTSLGKYWQNNKTSVSVHFAVSDTQTRQYVSMDDPALQARHPGNLRGVGVELSGLSRWSRNEWLAHKPMLRRAPVLCAEVALERGYNLSPYKLSPSALKNRQSGLTQHADLTGCFGGSHTDLGAAFPWDYFATELNATLNRLDPQHSAAHAATPTDKPTARPTTKTSKPATTSTSQAAANTLKEDALMAVTDAQFKTLSDKVDKLYDVLVDGKGWKGSSIASNLGYVVEKVNAVGTKVDTAKTPTQAPPTAPPLP